MKKEKHRWDDPQFTEAIRHMEKAYELSRQHTKVAAEAEVKYGWKGPLISGVMQDHWPKDVKAELRRLCDEMNWNSERAEACRPSKVRGSTMRALRNYIRKRDGVGMYL